METIKIYTDPKGFWNETSPYLKNEEAKNSLLLGLALTYQSEPEGCVFQAAVFENEKFKAAVLASRYLSNINLVASPVENKDHARLLFEVVQKNQIKINAVVSEVSTSQIYRELIHQAGRKTKTNMSQGIYRCRKVKMPEVPSHIKFRMALDADLELIGRWTQDFHSEAMPHDPHFDGHEFAKARIKKGTIYLVESDGIPVSMAAWSRDIKTSCSVNLVFTPKPLRRNGYASLVTGLLTQKMFDEGKSEAVLYTDMTNPTSNKIYQDLGYELVCNSEHFDIL